MWCTLYSNSTAILCGILIAADISEIVESRNACSTKHTQNNTAVVEKIRLLRRKVTGGHKRPRTNIFLENINNYPVAAASFKTSFILLPPRRNRLFVTELIFADRPLIVVFCLLSAIFAKFHPPTVQRSFVSLLRTSDFVSLI